MTRSNPLPELPALGQSIWLDFVSRDLLAGGDLDRLIRDDALKGVTSNPAIFSAAIGKGTDYDEPLRELLDERDRGAGELYEALAVADIRAAADALAAVYEETGAIDGYISLEVSPYLAHDTQATLAEARRLWAAVDRPNLMIKVPATPEGVPAIEALIADGINVNVTLLFSHDAYRTVADAYLGGLETLIAGGGDPSRVASVASFFVSRIDVAVNAAIDAGPNAAKLASIRNHAAIANARIAYEIFQERCDDPRWQALKAKGALPQRLLWASTGTKDPALPDTLYVDALIGPQTVNTVPPATLDAFRERGTARTTLTDDIDEAHATMDALSNAGIDIGEITDQLLADAVSSFADAFDTLLASIAGKRLDLLGDRIDRQAISLPAPLMEAHERELASWTTGGGQRRLWDRDATLWTDESEAEWLGWLDIAADAPGLRADMMAFASAVTGRYRTVLLLGMGGSSLGPEVLGEILTSKPGSPRLLVLDSTDPAQIRTIEAACDPQTTLHVVSSKSGGTLEPNILKDYFLARAREVMGDRAAEHFVAVTDPGSALETVAKDTGFARIFAGRADIGGRYSVLSPFGLVPATAAGLDVGALLDNAKRMALSCGPDVPPVVNPGVSLGVAMGVAALAGRDKLTVIADDGLAPFGAWLEQLVAESTGKRGKAIIPVDGEPLAEPSRYGRDRFFVHLSAGGGVSTPAIAALERAGHPVVHITVASPEAIAQEFFRFEIATAVAGAVMNLNPFDQPDVEDAKIATKALTDAHERGDAAREASPTAEVGGIRLYGGKGTPGSLEGAIGEHLAQLRTGDYAALLAYVERSAETEALLRDMRTAIRDAHGNATCVGFGPRFLHSTGQAYKGGPDTGLVLQVTADETQDIPVPGRGFSFGVVKAAQAAGDLAVLEERGRRTLRVHLGADVIAGLTRLRDAVRAACAHPAVTSRAA